MTIDLHGLTKEEAVGKVEMALWSFEQDNYAYQLEIITGYGGGVLKALVEDTLKSYNSMEWKHPNGNAGSYIINKI